jgi:hypothetical protein
MFLAVFFDESSSVTMTGHNTCQVQGITAVAWMTLRRYEQLILLEKFRLRVGRFFAPKAATAVEGTAYSPCDIRDILSLLPQRGFAPYTPRAL